MLVITPVKYRVNVERNELSIPVNRPETGGTIPLFAAMSRCPVVPPSTSLVLNSFDVVRPSAIIIERALATAVTPGEKAWLAPRSPSPRRWRKEGLARSCAC